MEKRYHRCSGNGLLNFSSIVGGIMSILSLVMFTAQLRIACCALIFILRNIVVSRLAYSRSLIVSSFSRFSFLSSSSFA